MLELTNTERIIMKCIWDLDRDVAVADLLECLKEKYQKNYARTTISVFMSYLRDKGYVSYEKRSHAFVYRPLVSKEDYQLEIAKNNLEQCFDDSLPRYMETLLNCREASDSEKEEIREMIKNKLS